MKQILTIISILMGSVMLAQDTLCVMMCLDEVINFNYETSEIIDRFNHDGDYEIKVNEGQVLCLDLSDDKNRFRDVTTTFSDGDHIHNTFNSKSNVIYTRENWGEITVHVSKARRRK